MIFKKALALFLAFVILLTLSACKSDIEDIVSKLEPTEEKKTQSHMTLLYSSADTFNPYTAETGINRQLCKLLYEPLVKLDNEFEPIYSLAQTVTTEGNICTAVIRDAVFSDGSSVTAQDVAYSFNLAKSSASVYAQELYYCSSATVQDSKTVVFNLTKSDPYFINLLDFPILKSGSEKITDSDSVLQPPIGCGRYKVNETRDGLVINDTYFGNKSSITEIKLINAPDTESVSHYVEVGAADIYYSDISDGEILRMGGHKFDINLNNLVYIGVNRNYGALGNMELRQAISAAIDRTKICRDAFYNNALPANGFFNPVWSKTKALQNIEIEANLQITIENLDKIGYNVLDTNGTRTNSSGIPLKLTLLVNSENRLRVAAAQLIADQLGLNGINVTVIEKSYDAYLESLTNGNFQLFLGEVKLTDNMDISSIVAEGGSAAYGLPVAKENPETEDKEGAVEEIATVDASTVVNGFYSGINTISDVASVLQTEMPLIPICYRTGVLFCNDNIENINEASASDIYFSIESYIYNDKD